MRKSSAVLRRAVVLLTPLLLLALSGCAVAPSPLPARDATATLLARPDFKTAAHAAPAWVTAALQQITDYETQLARAELDARK